MQIDGQNIRANNSRANNSSTSNYGVLGRITLKHLTIAAFFGVALMIRPQEVAGYITAGSVYL